MTTHIICNRCGKPMRPVYSDGTGAPTQGFCFCPPPVGWGKYTLAPVDWRDSELATLRADLAEARADVARFEAALDAANRELAQARKWASAWKAAAKDRRDDGLDTRSCNHRLSVEGDGLRAELAQARAERDEHTKWCMDVLGAQSCNRHTAVTLQEYVQSEIAVGCAQCASEENTRLRAELDRLIAENRFLRG